VSPGALVISHRTVLVKKGKAIITVRCRGASGSVCKGSLMLVASRHTSRLRAAANSAKPVRFTIAAGHDKVLHVSLPSASLTRVRHLRKAVAIATVTLNMPGGTTKSQGRAITLVRH
jgi:hypothetical protein